MENKAGTARTDLEQLLIDETAEPKALPLSLLEEITGDFSDDQEIGSGGFAVVYKGILGDMVVAVKKLADAFMDENIFHREVECLMRVKHKNVVRFLGYCADRQGRMETYEGKLVMADFHQRLLCFEYIPKGSLDKYIIDPHREWGMCYQIIEGICKGLQNLHDNHIVHLDLKPANILLDDNMTAKITDFGLSRCFNENQSRDITKTILGTIGYMAPELREGGIIARSADIYSLGVIIIEILTGQKGYQATEVVLESWRGRLEISQQEILCQQIQVCYETALECISFNPMNRPSSARNVFEKLHQMESDQEKNPQVVGGGANRKKKSDRKGRGDRHKRNPDKGKESDEHKYPNMDDTGGEQKKNSGIIGGGDDEQERHPEKSVTGEERDKSPGESSRGSGQKKNPEKSSGADKVDKDRFRSQPKDDDNEKMQLPEEETEPTVYKPLLSVDNVAFSAPIEVTTVLLRIPLHCEGCGKKVRRHLHEIEGVHNVRVDVAKSEVVVVGTMDVNYMRKYLRDKLHKYIELLWTSQKEEKMDSDGSGESEKMQNDKSAGVENVHKDMGEGFEVSGVKKKNLEKGGVADKVDKALDEYGPQSHPKEEKEKMYEPLFSVDKASQVTTVLLKIHIHCKNCGKKIRRLLLSIEGVHKVRVDVAKDEVVVVGTMDVAYMTKKLWDKLHKDNELPWTSKEDEKMDMDGSGESEKMQNHNSAAVENVHKGKGKGIEVSEASMALDQKDDKNNGGSSNDERKQKDKSAVAGDMRKEIELDGPSVASAPALAPIWAPYNSVAYTQPQAAPPSYYNYRGNADGMWEANAPDHQPYQPYPPYRFAPQMFSDENPNSCSAM